MIKKQYVLSGFQPKQILTSEIQDNCAMKIQEIQNNIQEIKNDDQIRQNEELRKQMDFLKQKNRKNIYNINSTVEDVKLQQQTGKKISMVMKQKGRTVFHSNNLKTADNSPQTPNINPSPLPQLNTPIKGFISENVIIQSNSEQIIQKQQKILENDLKQIKQQTLNSNTLVSKQPLKYNIFDQRPRQKKKVYTVIPQPSQYIRTNKKITSYVNIY